MLSDGSGGSYRFLTDGTPGTYQLAVTAPPGVAPSASCLPSSPPPLDPTGGPDPLVLGSGEVGATGFLASGQCAGNPFYLDLDLVAGDPVVLNNNLPFVCRPALPVTEIPALGPAGLALLAALVGIAGALAVRRHRGTARPTDPAARCSARSAASSAGTASRPA